MNLKYLNVQIAGKAYVKSEQLIDMPPHRHLVHHFKTTKCVVVVVRIKTRWRFDHEKRELLLNQRQYWMSHSDPNGFLDSWILARERRVVYGSAKVCILQHFDINKFHEEYTFHDEIIKLHISID